MDCRAVQELLEEYRRGELTGEPARAVEAHLAGCPACQARRSNDDLLAGLLRALPRTPAPAGLARRVRALGVPPRGLRRWLGRPWVAAAVAAAVVALALAPWVRFRPPSGIDALEALIQAGVREHQRILLRLEVEPGAVDDPTVVFARVRAVTDIELAPVFKGGGELRLLAAQPTLLGTRKTAAAALRYPTSPVTTYFVLSGTDLPMPSEGRVQIETYRPYMRQADGFNVIYWKQKDLAYLMVSGLGREACQKLFVKMRRAL